MPIYEYACKDCNHEESMNHSFDEKIDICPSCGSGEFKKLISSFLTAFKNKSQNKKVGNLTNEYIEDNRKILEDQKKEMKINNHD